MNIIYTVVATDADLYGILRLQRDNLPSEISRKEALEQGFVTIEHDFALLQRMNSPYPHIIARDGQNVVGYTLVMEREFREEIPVIAPMFDQIDGISFQGRPLKDANFFIMGQVCVAKAYRGQGVFQCLYQEMARRMSPHFDYIITEISRRNPRSVRAHQKVGFVTIREYTAVDGEEWLIVLWNISGK